MRLVLSLCVAPMLACGIEQSAGADEETENAPRGFEPPVITNAESPVVYPPDLFETEIGGTVVLHLFVDEFGTVVPESTRVAEGSGHEALDSAALAAAGAMRFAPARQDGQPVATSFLQPVHFRHPQQSGSRE